MSEEGKQLFMIYKILNYVSILRPKQWIKQGFILLPLIFGMHFTGIDLPMLVNVIYTMITFSIAASSIYIFNDLIDLELDEQHPKKKHRAIASGKVSRFGAIMMMTILGTLSIAMSALFGFMLVVGILGYMIMTIMYTIKLKHVPIVDVVIIAMGFVLRVILGGMATGIPVSAWLIIMTFLLATFIALSKRRNDLTIVGNSAIIRPVSKQYNLDFINGTMLVTSTITIMAYLMYTMSLDVILKFGTDKLWITALFVVLGIFKYMHLSFVENNTASPTEVLLHDRFLQFTIIGWILAWIILI